MGSASSRTLRNLPKSVTSQHKLKPLPSSIPNSAAHGLEDPPNPNLLSNLAQLGQVRVQQNPAMMDIPSGEAFRTTPSAASLSRTTTTNTNNTLTQPRRNTLSAPALAALFDTLKSDQQHQDAKQLVHQLNLDWDVYQRLAKYVNTPSIGRQKEIQLSDNSTRLLKEAIWVDPAYTRTS